MSAPLATAPQLAPYCGVVGEASVYGIDYALVECGPARLSREDFTKVTEALKGEGGSFWRENKVWIVPASRLPGVAAKLARAFPVARAA